MANQKPIAVTRDIVLASLRPNIEAWSKGLPSEEEITDETNRLKLPENYEELKQLHKIRNPEDLHEKVEEDEAQLDELKKVVQNLKNEVANLKTKVAALENNNQGVK